MFFVPLTPAAATPTTKRTAAARTTKTPKTKRPEWNAYLTDPDKFKLSEEEALRREARKQQRTPQKQLLRHTKHRSTKKKSWPSPTHKWPSPTKSPTVVTPPRVSPVFPDASALIAAETFTHRARDALAWQKPPEDDPVLRVARLEAQLEASEDARVDLEAQVRDLSQLVMDLRAKVDAEADARNLLLDSLCRPATPPPPPVAPPSPPPEDDIADPPPPPLPPTSSSSVSRRLW